MDFDERDRKDKEKEENFREKIFKSMDQFEKVADNLVKPHPVDPPKIVHLSMNVTFEKAKKIFEMLSEDEKTGSTI